MEGTLTVQAVQRLSQLHQLGLPPLAVQPLVPYVLEQSGGETQCWAHRRLLSLGYPAGSHRASGRDSVSHGKTVDQKNPSVHFHSIHSVVILGTLIDYRSF